jgi:hypothetical protein
MATKQNVSEVASKLAEGRIDPDSVAGREMFQEIADRIFKSTANEDEQLKRPA